MADNQLQFDLSAGVATLTINRPGAGNAFDPDMAFAMADACERINHDEAVKVALLRGSGSVFSVPGPGEPVPVSAYLAAVAKPVIAEINGDAIGPGLELALACDIRLAAEGARFAMPAVRDGGMPSNGGTQRLSRIVGKGKALELLFTATLIDAREALHIGLVSRVLPAVDLPKEAAYLAQRMAEMAPYSLRFAKEAVNKGMDVTLDQGLRLEADLYFLMHTTRDRVEGITSYLQKRKPRFEGR